MSSHSDTQVYEVRGINDNENTILKVIKTDGLQPEVVENYVYINRLILYNSIKRVL